MSARTPVILLVIAAALVAYVLLFERGRPGRSEIESRSGFLLQTLVRERITRIRMASGTERIALRREGEGFDETWTLEEPEESPADPEKVEDYVRNWEFAVAVRTLESPTAEDLVQFGADAPAGEVTFEMDRAKVRVTLASGAPVDGGGYVQIDDQPAIHVVGTDVVELFSQTSDTFAAKTESPMLDDLDAPEAPEGGQP